MKNAPLASGWGVLLWSLGLQVLNLHDQHQPQPPVLQVGHQERALAAHLNATDPRLLGARLSHVGNGGRIGQPAGQNLNFPPKILR